MAKLGEQLSGRRHQKCGLFFPWGVLLGGSDSATQLWIPLSHTIRETHQDIPNWRSFTKWIFGQNCLAFTFGFTILAILTQFCGGFRMERPSLINHQDYPS